MTATFFHPRKCLICGLPTAKCTGHRFPFSIGEPQAPDPRDQELAALRAENAALSEERDTFLTSITEAALAAWPEANDVGWDAPQIIAEIAAERDVLEAENAALKAKLDWRANDDGKTHSPGCHEWHWHCAMARIADLDVKLARVSAPVAFSEVTDAFPGASAGSAAIAEYIIAHRLKDPSQ